MTIGQLNQLDRDAFIGAVGFAFEHSPWIAAEAWAHRPFRDSGELHARMVEIISAARSEKQVALIAAHPDLAGRVAREGRLTTESRGEQASAGLDRLSPEEVARFDRLNSAYRERFGFPFVICAREHTKESILTQLEARTRNDHDTEIATALSEIAKIARLRLEGVLEDAA